MRDERARFRTTVWPGFAVAVPPVDRAEAVTVDADGWVRYAGALERQELPDELAVRELLRLDLDDTDEVVGFVREHGTLGRAADTGLGWQHDSTPPKGAACHVSDLRLHLAVAQALATHAVLHLDGSDTFDAWSRFLNRRRRFPNDETTAWGVFVQELNNGLRSYPMHVRVEVPMDELGAIETGVPRPGLFGALCVQVANLLAEGLPTRICANETCGQRFVRQTGRAEHNQNRTTGVIYCSRSCARAQTERERRRRKGAGQ